MEKSNNAVNTKKPKARTLKEAEQLAAILLSLPAVRRYRAKQVRKAKVRNAA